MRTNMSTRGSHREVTHEGGRAMSHQPALVELERAVNTCMLFENTFYEKGSDIADRIASLCTQVSAEDLSRLAKRARTELKLRHVPLFLAVQMVKLHTGSVVGETIQSVVLRPDQAGELISLYWKGNDGLRQGKRAGRPQSFCGPKSAAQPNPRTLPAQMKKGLAAAFTRWNEYQLGKWNRDAQIKLRDVLFLTHPKPLDQAQDRLWKRLIGGFCDSCYLPIMDEEAVARYRAARDKIADRFREPTRCRCEVPAPAKLAVPETWEVGLSAAKTPEEKRAVWERLLRERKLGYIALLMNLRNMQQAAVDHALIKDALLRGAPKSWALPHRFVSAVKHAPNLAAELSAAMCLAITERLPDEDTVILIDVSGSMDAAISGRSEMLRWQAAGALAVHAREMCEQCTVHTFSERLVQVPAYRGLALIEGVARSQPHRGTYLRRAQEEIRRLHPNARRVLVMTDEQSTDGMLPAWAPHSYLMNLAAYKPALDTSQGWERVSGFSERLLHWIAASEGVQVRGEEETDD